VSLTQPLTYTGLAGISFTNNNIIGAGADPDAVIGAGFEAVGFFMSITAIWF
jgi:hypothetical protein